MFLPVKALGVEKNNTSFWKISSPSRYRSLKTLTYKNRHGHNVSLNFGSRDLKSMGLINQNISLLKALLVKPRFITVREFNTKELVRAGSS